MVLETMGTVREIREGGSIDKKQSIIMLMGILDCPVCFEPLSPPILQCPVGHFICLACSAKVKKCPQCSRGSYERCFGMEHVVESIVVPCSYAMNGCTEKIAYFNHKIHEKACPHGPCFCPDSGCGFTGPAAVLWEHFTTQHKWPSTAIKYHEPFNLDVRPGIHVLRADDGLLFLVNMVALELVGHAISLVCVRPKAPGSMFPCYAAFSSLMGHLQMSLVYSVRCSSLSDGLLKDYFCVVPKASGIRSAIVLRATIASESAYDVEDELENEDEDDNSYDEYEDDLITGHIFDI